MPAASLDIVIVSFCSRELVLRCLKSLADHAPPGTAVYVVDNDSRDGTVEAIRARFPAVDAVGLDWNAGFGRASNEGSRRGSAQYVLFLNPDTEIVPGSLETLFSVLEDRPEVGVVGCRLVRPDGTLDHAGRRSFPTIAGALGHFTGLAGRRGVPSSLAQYAGGDEDPGPVDSVNGAFMLVRRSAFESVGGFDEGYWMYMEDLDLCYRLLETGHLTWYEPSVSALHVKHGTSGRWRSPRLTYAFHYGMLRFYRAHYAPRRPRFVNAAVYAGLGVKLVLALARNTAGRALAR